MKNLEKNKSKGEKSRKEIKCYGCNEVGHIKPECPLLKKDKKKLKQKALATWSDDESISEENLCLMGQHEDQEVSSQSSSSSINDFTFEELQNAFDELAQDFKKLSMKNNALKKKILSLENEVNSLMSEKDSLKTKYDELQRKNESLELSLKEAKCLQLSFEKVNRENVVLKNALNVQRKDFHKRRKGKNEFTKRKHSYGSHSRITCHYCRQCGHSINKCFIRNNPTRYKQIWLPKGIFDANNGKPKMVWVPKACG